MPREKLVDVALRITVDDPGDDVGEVGLWLDTDELAGLD